MSFALEKVISLLNDSVEAARMESASFGPISMQEPVKLSTPAEVDAFIKERISLWLTTWVSAPTRHALTILEANKELLAAQRDLCDQLHSGAFGNALQRMDSALQSAVHQHYKG